MSLKTTTLIPNLSSADKQGIFKNQLTPLQLNCKLFFKKGSSWFTQHHMSSNTQMQHI